MTQPDPDNLLELADEIDRGNGVSNELDVRIEVARFEPCPVYTACRANAAGTKVIYTKVGGGEETCWAWDWTQDRKSVSEVLRARARSSNDQGRGK